MGYRRMTYRYARVHTDPTWPLGGVWESEQLRLRAHYDRGLLHVTLLKAA
jgi:hypothetical protein